MMQVVWGSIGLKRHFYSDHAATKPVLVGELPHLCGLYESWL